MHLLEVLLELIKLGAELLALLLDGVDFMLALTRRPNLSPVLHLLLPSGVAVTPDSTLAAKVDFLFTLSAA